MTIKRCLKDFNKSESCLKFISDFLFLDLKGYIIFNTLFLKWKKKKVYTV